MQGELESEKASKEGMKEGGKKVNFTSVVKNQV